ncbi:radical SAM protein [Candidatus Sumerlaeota bacterium]|nr:radical SAM protein [Candidatus Sumerlaeota bacterium]
MLVQCPMMVHFWPSTGLGYLCEYLRLHDYQVKMLDQNIDFFHLCDNREIYRLDNDNTWYSEELFAPLREKYRGLMDQQAQAIADLDAPIVGYTVSSTNVKWTLEVARRVRRLDPQRLTVFGGSEFILPESAERYRDEADVFVIGEGEETLLELIEHHHQNMPLTGIDGLICKNERNELSAFTPRQMPEDLDRFPFPTFQEADLSRYLFPNVCISASRGCIRRCTFCSDHAQWCTFRTRSADHVIQEMEYHAKKRLSETFYITSSLLNFNPVWFEEFCDKLIEKRMNWEIVTEMIIDRRMTPELLRKARQAGITHVEYGLECGSDKILRLMKKGFTTQMARENIRNTHNAGIVCEVNLITGFPGEMEEDHRATKQFLSENAAYIDVIKVIHACAVLPNSPLRRRYKEFGIEDPDQVLTWRIGAENTYELRQQRMNDLIDHARKLGIALAFEHQPTGLKSYLKPKYFKQIMKQPWRSYRKIRRIMHWKKHNRD